MRMQLRISRQWASLHGTVLVLAAMLSLWTDNTAGVAACVPRPAPPQAGQVVRAQHLSATQLPAPAWWQRIYGPLQWAMGDQGRMIRFGFLGMLLALVIIWWRR